MTRVEKWSPGQARVGSVFTLIMAVGILSWGGVLVAEARESAAWPTTPGTITEAKVATRHATTGNNAPRITYVPSVRYTYRVDGAPYQGNRIQIVSRSFDNRGKADVRVDRYRRNKAVVVHYDPENPNRSVLQPGMGAGNYLPFLMGGVLLGGAGWLHRQAK